MGDIKKLKKKFERPRKPWEKNRIIAERELSNTYGYKNKKEIWRLNALLRGFRAQARTIVASRSAQAKIEGENLLRRLERMGLLNKDSSFDDVLELSIDDISRRRLLSLVLKKGIARTPKQARQFIVHKHIMVGDKKVSSPNYIVLKEEEDSIMFAGNSCFTQRDHPLISSMREIAKADNKVELAKEEKKIIKKDEVKEIKKEEKKVEVKEDGKGQN